MKKQAENRSAIPAQPSAQLRAGKPREWYERLMREEPKFEMKEAPRLKISKAKVESALLDQLAETPNSRDRIAFLEKYLSVFHPEDSVKLIIALMCRNGAQANAREVLPLLRKMPRKLQISAIEKFLSDGRTYRLEFAKEAVVLGIGNPKLLKKIIAGTYYESSFEGTRIKEFFDDETDTLSTVSYITAGVASAGAFAIFFFKEMGIGAFVVLDLVAGAIGSYVAGGLVALGMMGLGKAGLAVAGACRFAGSSAWWVTKYAYYALKPKGDSRAGNETGVG